MPHEVLPGGDLVTEGEGDGEVGRQVHGVPRLVAQPAPCGPRARDRHESEQQQTGGRRQHGRVRRQDPPAGRGDAPVVDEGVPLDDQQHVRDQQEHGVGAQAAMPGGQPVEADGVLEPGQPRHQQQLHQHQVRTEQPGQPARSRDCGTGTVQGAGVQPPHHDDGASAREQRQPDTDMARRSPRSYQLRGCVPLCRHGHQQSTSSLSACDQGRSGVSEIP